jgi:hypothetical protein
MLFLPREWIMNRFRIFGVALIAVLAGCAATPSGPIRIDGSSPQACEASWKKLEASLNSQQRMQLDVALLLIGATKQHRLGTMTTSAGISPETIREEIDGKDFAEIVALGKATGARIGNVERSAGST